MAANRDSRALQVKQVLTTWRPNRSQPLWLWHAGLYQPCWCLSCGAPSGQRCWPAVSYILLSPRSNIRGPPRWFAGEYSRSSSAGVARSTGPQIPVIQIARSFEVLPDRRSWPSIPQSPHAGVMFWERCTAAETFQSAPKARIGHVALAIDSGSWGEELVLIHGGLSEDKHALSDLIVLQVLPGPNS